jgi:hypothetical protein
MLLCELASVARWLKTAELRGHALAIYSCTPQGLWHRDFLPAHIDSRIAYQPRVNLSPLLDVLEDASTAIRE